MKIIRPGILPTPKPKIYTGECPDCHCIIEVSEEELLTVGFYNYSHSRVDCPTPNCNSNITLRLKKPYINKITYNNILKNYFRIHET